MDLGEIEFAAKIVYAICASHPEICPHSHRWTSTSAPKDGKRVERYECTLCGHTYTKEIDA